MIHDGNPEGLELAEVLKWGHPWHGLVKGGVLDTGIVDPSDPQATIKRIYSQPSGGNVWAFRVPGLPEPTTEPEETAQGLRWLNYALISGSIGITNRAQLYGEPLPPASWLLLAEEGSRWLVSLTLPGNFPFNAALVLPIRLTRYGDFGLDASQIDLTASCNVDQQSPMIPLSWEINGVSGSCPDIDNGYLVVHDLSDNGRRAILAIYGGNVGPGTADKVLNEMLYPQDPIVSRFLRRPLGFLQLEISEFNATLTVLAGRNATLGQLNCNSVGGFSYTCVPGGCSDESWYPKNGGGNASALREERIVGYWFNQEGVATPVMLSIDSRHSGTESTTADVSTCGSYRFTSELSGTMTAEVTLHYGLATLAVTTGFISGTHSTVEEIGAGCRRAGGSTASYVSSVIEAQSHNDTFDHVVDCAQVLPMHGEPGCAELPPYEPFIALCIADDPTLRYDFTRYLYAYHPCYPLYLDSNTLLTLYVPPKWNTDSGSYLDAAVAGYIGRYGWSGTITRFHPFRDLYSTQHPDGSTVYSDTQVCFV